MEQWKLGEGIHKPVQCGVVMEIRWKLHGQVVTTHVPTQVLEMKENEELKSQLKWGKFCYAMLDYLKNKEYIVLTVQGFRFLNGTIHHVLVDGVVWCDPLIFLTH